MKNLRDYLTEAAVQDHSCSEKTCATCFENRGCIYEMYLATVAADPNQFFSGVEPPVSAQQHSRA